VLQLQPVDSTALRSILHIAKCSITDKCYSAGMLNSNAAFCISAKRNKSFAYNGINCSMRIADLLQFALEQRKSIPSNVGIWSPCPRLNRFLHGLEPRKQVGKYQTATVQLKQLAVRLQQG